MVAHLSLPSRQGQSSWLWAAWHVNTLGLPRLEKRLFTSAHPLFAGDGAVGGVAGPSSVHTMEGRPNPYVSTTTVHPDSPYLERVWSQVSGTEESTQKSRASPSPGKPTPLPAFQRGEKQLTTWRNHRLQLCSVDRYSPSACRALSLNPGC